MADKKNQQSFFDKLKKFFSSSIVLKYEDDTKIKVFDVDNLQTIKNLETNRIIDQRSNLFQHFYEQGGNLSGLGFGTMRSDLYRNYELMDQDPVISSVLDIYAEETTMRSEYGDIVTVSSSKERVQKSIENLLYDILNIEFNLPWWVRNLAKYGDFYLKLDIVESIGVTNIIPLSPYGVERIEDTLTPHLVKFRYDESLGTSLISYTNHYFGRKDFENFEVAHFRMLSDSNYLPYGRSMIEGARKVWTQLTLMIDAMMIHRIMRAPEKRIFSIDIGTLGPNEIDAYMQKIISRIKKIPLIDEATGNFNLKFNLVNMLEDFYLPVRGDKSGTKIDTLPGMEWTGTTDIEFLEQRLFAALKVPKAFIANTSELGAKCMGPDTLIPLLDGRQKTIKEISELFVEERDQNLWIYSFDFKTNSTVQSKIKIAEKTRRNAQVVNVYLDNGTNFVCTPDHHLIKSNGEEIEAQFLKLNDSLKVITLVDTLGVEESEEDRNFNYKSKNSICVIKVELMKEKIDTYNLEVENENHNYLIGNGIVVKNSTLAAQDLRFARTIDRIQKIIISELTKIAIIHLYAQGYTEEDILNFELNMSSPSTVFENEKVELIKNKVEAAKNIKELKLHSDKWIYNNIFNMTDDEADEEEQNIILDLKKLFRHSQIEEEGNDPMVTKNILKKSESEFGEEGSTETGVSGEEPISSQKGKNDFESSIDKSISKKEEGEKEKSEDEETKKEEIEKKSKNDKERKPPETVHVKKKISKKPKTYFVKRKPVTSPMNTAERKIKDDYQYPLLHRFRGGSPLSTERYNKKKRKLIETAFDLSDEVKFDSLKGTFMDEDILF